MYHQQSLLSIAAIFLVSLQIYSQQNIPVPEGTAQTTAITYQGSLKQNGVPANGTYDIQLALFDALSGGTQISVQSYLGVQVENGVFTAIVNFGNQFPDALRFIEVRVRPAGGGAFMPMSPRQQVNSTPYAIHSLTAQSAANALQATNATTAANATQLGGVAAANYVQSGAATINAGTQFSIGGSRAFSVGGSRNTFLGIGSGSASPNGFATDNSFFGFNTGTANTVGAANAFFGSRAGQGNTDGGENSFFGTEAGQTNSSGDGNTFIGRSAGKLNSTGDNNTFVGATAGDANTTGSDNSFLGRAAGGANVSGIQNAFFGRFAGQLNVAGNNNAFFGFEAGKANTTNNNSFFGSQSGLVNTSGTANAFFGFGSGAENSIGSDNSFFGVNTGRGNTEGAKNTFIGRVAGRFNTTGFENTYLGYNTASSSITGNNNVAIGASANVADGLSFATVIGSGASVSSNNTVVIGRTADRVIVRGDLFLPFLASLKFDVVNFGGDNPACYSNVSPDNNLGACSSSISEKINVNASMAGYDVIKRLRPVTFNWKRNGQPSIGLIAEEVNGINPLLSTYDNKGSLVGVQWNGITVSLVNAAKEQQAQIDNLQTIVRDQNAKIDRLQQMICELKPEAKACRKE